MFWKQKKEKEKMIEFIKDHLWIGFNNLVKIRGVNIEVTGDGYRKGRLIIEFEISI